MRKAFNMTIKKSIVALMVASFFTLSAGYAFGGNPVIATVQGNDGNTYKLKINKDNGKFFLRDVSGQRRLCQMHVVTPQDVTTFLFCVGGKTSVVAVAIAEGLESYVGL